MSPMSKVSAGLQAIVLALVFVVGAAPTGVEAQGLVNVQKLSAPLANELVGESVAICAQKGYNVVAVVVDLDGVRQALLRGNGAPIHSLDNAYYKAWDSIAKDRDGFLAWMKANVLEQGPEVFAAHARKVLAAAE